MLERKEYVPRPWQKDMTPWQLDVPRDAIWATMGVGKTVPTLTSLQALKLAGDDGPALALGPLRVARDVWSKEALKWKHLEYFSVQPIIGDTSARMLALRNKADLYTINYENIPWLIEYLGENWPFQKVIADEATRLKSFKGGVRKNGRFDVIGGERAKALARIAHSKTKWFFELTGTPAPNGLEDLWGQAWYLDVGKRLGASFGAFKNRWFQRSFDGYGSSALPFAQQQIHDALRDICLTVDIKDFVDVKEPVVRNVFVDLPTGVRRLYNDMEKQMFMEMEERTCEVFNAAARTQKLLQIANGAVYVDPLSTDDSHPLSKEWKRAHDEKLLALESIIEESGGMPVLCAYQFRSDRHRILSKFDYAADLSTPEGFAKFMKGRCRLGIAHPASLGHGVDGLQDVTNICCFFGHDWNSEQYDQMIGRVGPVRQMQSGYDRPMFLYHIIARDTMDEAVMARREMKRSVQDALMEYMKRKNGK